ncbi:unnamed protein product [Mytilus edulis]|uniref:SUEL-type lectin domain-containing protein n=1 Tax=Mytilus edulis TaxID=6550 RepID=A0A8S3V3W0_MYTED|nr:unnamed protein product [Mytilus edulis]
MTSNDQIMPTVNPTYTPSSRPSKHENHQKANLVKAPGGSNLSTTHAVYFDNRTDDKAIKLCPIQQPGIQTNKHESNTYSHLRTTTDDSDDMYDHTVRNAVRNTCDGDYGVAHIRITEDDYNVSGTIIIHSPKRKTLFTPSYQTVHLFIILRGCKALHPNTGGRIRCPAFHNITIADVSYGDSDCPANKPPRQNIEHFKDQCNDRNTCYVRNDYYLLRIASIYFHCKDENAMTYIEISTKSHDRNSRPVDFTSTESPGNKHNETIAGGIVGGVLLSICIIVGVVLLRRRICTTSDKEQVMTNLNPTFDPTHGQTHPDSNQQDHLMSSPDALYVATSHAVNVDNTTNGDSNTYSHIRNNVDDSDVMYDHTIRHHIHNACDGDYGIAHRRVTDDDYDVSGNYSQSFSKVADPVYN